MKKKTNIKCLKKQLINFIIEHLFIYFCVKVFITFANVSCSPLSPLTSESVTLAKLFAVPKKNESVKNK